MTRYTVSNAAKRAGVTRQTINNWIRNGTLEARTMNGKRYVDMAQVYRRADWKWKQSEKAVES